MNSINYDLSFALFSKTKLNKFSDLWNTQSINQIIDMLYSDLVKKKHSDLQLFYYMHNVAWEKGDISMHQVHYNGAIEYLMEAKVGLEDYAVLNEYYLNFICRESFPEDWFYEFYNVYFSNNLYSIISHHQELLFHHMEYDSGDFCLPQQLVNGVNRYYLDCENAKKILFSLNSCKIINPIALLDASYLRSFLIEVINDNSILFINSSIYD